MSSEPFGLLAFLVYLAAVVLSIPAAGGALLLARRQGIRRAADLVGLAVVGLVAVAGAFVGLATGPIAGLTLAALGFVALVALWAIPVLVGTVVVERVEGVPGETALGYAVAGLPAGMLASAVWFVVPGGVARYNLTFLSGPAAAVGLLLFLAILLLGPGIVGVGLYRLASRRR